MSVLVGGVSELYQGDLDLGRRVVERLAGHDLGSHVVVEDLHYGAVAVVQRVQELAIHTLILVGAAVRGRPPGALGRRRYRGDELRLTPEQLQAAVTDAVTGYVTVDLVVEVAHALGAMPSRVIAVDVEPAVTEPGDGLSPEVAAVLDQAVEAVRTEVQRAPLLELAGRLRGMVGETGPSSPPAVEALRELLDDLDRLDDEGRWGAAFASRDRLRRLMAAGQVAAGMDRLEWGLWWALVEELDRLQRLEVGGT